MENSPSTITLSTDFGIGNYFTGVMHGVILNIAPKAHIIDLCHTIRPHDTQQATRLITTNYHYFPKGSIHVVVVDPGVGSHRKIILLKTDNYYFLAPNNGILSPIADSHPKAQVWAINRPDLYIKPLSKTFHGRDIFAPIAAHLIQGEPPDFMGIQLDLEDLTHLQLPNPLLDYSKGQLNGTVVDIDTFGNIITNITIDDINKLAIQQADLTIEINNRELRGIASCYSTRPPGEALAIFNSAGSLEIAINQGRANDILHVKLDTKVVITSQ